MVTMTKLRTRAEKWFQAQAGTRPPASFTWLTPNSSRTRCLREETNKNKRDARDRPTPRAKMAHGGSGSAPLDINTERCPAPEPQRTRRRYARGGGRCNRDGCRDPCTSSHEQATSVGKQRSSMQSNLKFWIGVERCPEKRCLLWWTCF